MNTSTDDWRNKYLDGVDALTKEKERFRATESILKRLAGRLCIACLGLSPRLDQEIKKLQTMLRREGVAAGELEPLMAPLSDAVVALDDKPAATASSVVNAAVSVAPIAQTLMKDNALADEKHIRATLAALVAELKHDSTLRQAVAMLDAKLSEPLTAELLPPILSSLTEMVGQRIQNVERARQDAEALLTQLVKQLDEIGHFVVDQNQNQSNALASRESLNAQLTGEFKAMSDGMETASELQHIRTLVRHRLDTIGKHLQEFQQREVERSDAMRTRNEQMQNRVAELEAEAQKLQSQLHAEQQVSLLDGLTKLPNRLAYDARIEDELQRWKRFGQPVSIAVWDVDHFKNVNDTYGHRAGDRVLCNVAEYLKNQVRSTDFIARYGGEEFVMILAGASIDAALKLVETMRVAITTKLGFNYRGQPVPVTASCGVTAFKADDSAESAFERADKALYQAKKDGRNRCVAI